MAFVEELEHEYQSLLNGAKDDSGDVASDQTALAAANDQII